MVIVCYREGIYSDQPKKETHMSESKRVADAKLLLFSSGHITLLVLMCDNMQGILPTKEVH